MTGRFTTERYLALAEAGVLGPEDRVELLEGVVVSMAPHNVRHASGIMWASEALFRAVGERAVVRVQLSFVAGKRSVPEPDVAIVPGSKTDYLSAHPANALLIVEVADSSLGQDRITKSWIYAKAGVPEYWLVNLRDDCVEVFRDPDPRARRYRSATVAGHGERLALTALAGVIVAVDDLLPPAAKIP
jgi:Uma2 family endonuclease